MPGKVKWNPTINDARKPSEKQQAVSYFSGAKNNGKKSEMRVSTEEGGGVHSSMKGHQL